MKGLKQKTVDAITYIASNYPTGTFHTEDVPYALRKSMSGLVARGHVETVSRDSRKRSTFSITPAEIRYVKTHVVILPVPPGQQVIA